MCRPVLLLVLVSSLASAQTPNALVQFADPPEANGASYVVYPRHLLWNTTLQCAQRPTATGWLCLTTSAETTAAMTSAVSQAGANAAATYMTAATANAALANLGGRVDGVQATAEANAGAISSLQSGATALTSRVSALEMGSAKTSDLDAATAALNARIDGVQATATAAVTQAGLAAAVQTLQGADTALAARVSALEAAYVSQSALASALATVNARIDAAQASARLCTTATLSGLSIPLTGGLSSTVSVPLAGAPVGTTCSVAGNNRLPLGATGDPIVSTAGTVSVAFRGNGGLLSSLIAIPSGTYRVCCDR